MKTIRHIAIGIIIGVIISIAVPALAQEFLLSKSDCKVVVNGQEIEDDNLPILLMEPGYNYLPAALFRGICEQIGIDFNFDSETKEIRLDAKVSELKSDSGSERKRENKMSEETKDQVELAPELYKGKRAYRNANLAPQRVENGLTIYDLLGVEYISIDEAKNEHFCPIWEYDEKNDYGYVNIRDRKKGELILQDIPFVWGGNLRYDVLVEYDYYINTILPLLSE